MTPIIRLPEQFCSYRQHADLLADKGRLIADWRSQEVLQVALEREARGQLHGFCAWCARETVFYFDPPHSGTHCNWRESLKCKRCRLINRWRASLHLFTLLFEGSSTEPIYLTEQVTPLFRALRKRFPSASGSEYVDAGRRSGDRVFWRLRRVQHEDATCLSFADASKAAVLSFDVLEHIPDYRAALREFARVLRPDGLLLLTAPFLVDAPLTRIRARQEAGGEITHLLPPIHHGNPMNGAGVLCYQEFGWDLLNEMRQAGFSRAEVITTWAPELGYLGSLQPFFAAWR